MKKNLNTVFAAGPMPLILGLMALAGCAGPTALTTADNGVIHYMQYDKNNLNEPTVEQILVQENHKDYGGLYSKARNKANIKKIPLPKWEMLTTALEDLGYMDRARPLPANLKNYGPNVSKVILVENDEGTWILENLRDDRLSEKKVSLSEKKDFIEMGRLIRSCFTSVFSLQYVESEKGGEAFFREVQKRIEEDRKKDGQ